VVPEVELQLALGGGGAGVGREGTVAGCDIDGLADCPVVDGLEYLLVEFGCLPALKGDEQLLVHVSEALHADTDGAVAEVGVSGLLYWVEVVVDDFVEVPGADFGYPH
jgi:hypothetical protein